MNQEVRVGINGFGRIGRCVLKHCFDRSGYNVVGINDLADTGDLAYFIQLLRQRAPHTPLAVVGYSLGGNVLLKWLGEAGKQAPLQAAVAVSVPFLLHHAAARLDRGLSRIYQWSLLRRMRRAVSDKRQKINLPITVDDLSMLRSFRDFDEYVTAPLHGFNGADHCYAVVSSRQYLKQIAVPTLIVHARDDPFMAEAAIPGPDGLFDDPLVDELLDIIGTFQPQGS